MLAEVFLRQQYLEKQGGQHREIIDGKFRCQLKLEARTGIL